MLLGDKNTSKFKQRLNSNNKVTPWSWVEFKNNARSDGLVLHHWAKGAADLHADRPYAFEKFNTKLDIPVFETEDEYKEKDLEDEDWSYDETKYLFELCNEYDLRWPVILDRYQFDDRSLEDLKERFYSVCEKLLSALPEIPDEKTTTIINSLKSFDKQKEIDRKEYLSKLLKRSPAEIAEEESLVIEARKFELAAKKVLSERAALLRILDAPQSTGSIQLYQSSQGLAQLYNALMVTDKNKKRKVETPVPPQIPPAAATPSALIAEAQSKDHQQKSNQRLSVSGLLPSDQKNKKTPGQSPGLLSKKLTPDEQLLYGLSEHSEKILPGVILRSTKLTTFKPIVQAKVNALLNELEIPSRPTMPTAKVCEKHDQLLQTINLLLETKRQSDKLESEISLIKTQQLRNS